MIEDSYANVEEEARLPVNVVVDEEEAEITQIKTSAFASVYEGRRCT